MAIYDTFAKATATLLGSELGGSLVLRRRSGGGTDVNGNELPVTLSDKRVRGVVKNKEVWDKGSYLGSKLIALLDSKTPPEVGDQLIAGSQSYNIVGVKTNAPNGVTVISYEVELS